MPVHALLIEVGLLDQRWHGVGDWPPAPFRLFQALVAGAYGGRWAAEDTTAKDDAFRWLERLAAPVLAAPLRDAGRPVTIFVPNNDLDSLGGDPARIGEIRSAKTIRPALLQDPQPSFHFVWCFDEGLNHAEALCRLTERLHTFGRGVDSAFARAAIVTLEAAEAFVQACSGVVARPSAGSGAAGAPCPTVGSLESLKARHAATTTRFQTISANGKRAVLFRQPPKALFRPVAYDSPPTRLFYTLRRTGASLMHPVPQIDALTLAEAVRDSLAARLISRMPDLAPLVERFVIGRHGVAAERRVRILPLPTIGHPYASPAIRRVTVDIPADCPLRSGDIAWALAGLVLSETVDDETGEITDEVALVPIKPDGVTGSYNFGIPARRWCSVTPVALPLAPGRARSGAERAAAEAQAAAALATAMRHAGFDARPLEVRLQREPFHLRGERSDAFVPGRFAGRLRHIEVLFDRPVDGPLVLGDGRFLGLGLMRPVAEVPPGLHVFAVDPALAPAADQREPVLRALRRAVMALAQRQLGTGKLPTLFHGHDEHGRPARSGRHEHLFYAAWSSTPGGRLDRLAVIGPHLADRTVREDSKGLARLARALEPLQELRAGRSGLLRLTPAATDEAIFGWSNSWTSLTSYCPTRHPARSQDPAAAIVEDVVAECARRGLPRPDIDEVHVKAGPQGGLSATLRLTFTVQVAGPLMLGRGSHFGIGLFASSAQEETKAAGRLSSARRRNPR